MWVRLVALAWLLLWALPGGLCAQALITTQITTASPEVYFRVDGQAFQGAAVFTWPAGSKHLLEIDPWQYGMSTLTNRRFVFQHWNSSAGPLGSTSNKVTITADAGISWFRADMLVEYAIWLRFFHCDETGPCASPGTVWVNQTAYLRDTDVWAQAGSTVLLDASPNAGYVFVDWGGGATTSIGSMVLNAAVTLYPRFAVARAIQFHTVPEGLQLLADRAPITAPATLEWGWTTTHTLTALSPQRDSRGRSWVFRSWGDGGAATHTYQVEPGASAASVVAEFVPAATASLLTIPPGLALAVDGLEAASPRNVSWAAGEAHLVTAPLRQTDSAGTTWVFREWSNGAANSQSVSIADAQIETGIRLTATYDSKSRILLDSTPGGLALTVDGAECRTPCAVERNVGSTVRVFAPPSIPVSEGMRLDFSSWEGIGSGTFTATAGLRKITVRYGTSYRLALSTQPANGASWRLSPTSADGFYPAGSVVVLGLDAASGMSFRGWGLDLSGSMNPASLLMDAPHSVAAVMDLLPAPPASLRVLNSAGETKLAAVAPGSIASLFGSALADTTEKGEGSTLRQSLAGVTLRCAGRLFALFYVSPEQINFQVPGDLVAGDYTLEVHRESGSLRKAAFTVARNAPGLFVALHQDGAAITAEAPAQRGELVTLYGTGFGPYALPLTDGFPVPATPPFRLMDELAVSFQGQSVTPEFAGAVPGAVGLAMVRMRIPKELDAALETRILVTAGAIESNALLLSIK